MRLEKLALRNFKGLKDYVFEPGGKDAAAFGDNGTGKTTISDALHFLLTDLDSHGNSIDPKTLKKTGEAYHKLNHEVEGTLSDAEEILVLRKVFKEKWTGHRGAAQKEFTGHIVDHFIDGVPVKQKEYKERLSKIANDQVMKILINPDFFAGNLPWQDRRRVLIDLGGGVTDDDVIRSSEELADLPAILGGRTADDHKRVLAASKKKLNEEIQAIPIKISEVQRGLADENGINEDAERLIVLETIKEINAKDKELASLEMGGGVGAKKEELANVKASIAEQLNDLKATHAGIVDGKQTIVHGLRKEVDGICDDISKLDDHITTKQALVDRLESDINDLKEHFFKIRDQKPVTGSCPTCGNPLPTDEMQKAIAAHNLQKSKDLERIDKSGQEKVALKTKIAAEINVHQDEKGKLETKLTSRKDAMAGAQKEFDAVKANVPAVPEDSADNLRKIELEKEIAALEAGTQINTTPLIIEIDRLQMVRNEAQEKVNKILNNKSGKERIAELEKEEKKLLAEFEKCEHALYLIEKFIKAKVALIEGPINEHFKIVRWKLFNEQINGGVSPCCVAMVDGVPYSSGLNTGKRINAGIDIINALSTYYNVNMPVMIDNAESITGISQCDSQVIKLIVSEQDKDLRVEIKDGE